MERYLLRSGQKVGQKHIPIKATEHPKMAYSPLAKTQESAIEEGQEVTKGEEEANIDWDIQSCSQPFIDYKRLAKEVATRIAPDLQETLETTIQSTLLKIQSNFKAHEGILNDLEPRVSSLEDENLSLSSKVSSINRTVHQLEEKLEDLENRSQRNNLRMVGLPESVLAKDQQNICEVALPHTVRGKPELQS